jgi:hypothetical protein
LGVLADLVQPPVFVFVPVALYRLLKHGHPNAALASVALVTITTGITCLNAVFACENCLPWPEALNRRSHPAGSSSAKAICCICSWMFLADTTKAARALCNVYRVTRLRTR